MPSTKGYRSYHGKGGAGRIVLIVLLCLILLAAVGFLVLQRYAVYGSDGSIRFDLPWKQTEEPSGPSAPDGASRTPDAPDDSPNVIIDEPEPPAKPELTELHGAELSESVLRGSADAALAAVPEGANAVALRVKNAQGELLYDSALQEAIDVNAVKGGSGANAVIEALTGSEVYTIARINATHDSLYSFAHMADAGVLQLNYAGYIWYDPDSTFYLAPEKPAARQYIVSVARECAELGFDELLFDEFGYPTRGRLNNIDESARTLSKSARACAARGGASQRDGGIRRPPFRAARRGDRARRWKRGGGAGPRRACRGLRPHLCGNDGGAAPRAHRGSGAV